MNQLIIQHIACASCNERLIDSDNFCRICGLARNEPQTNSMAAVEPIAFIDPGSSQTALQTADQTSIVPRNSSIAKLLNNRLAVISVLAVIGPLGLPALWFSSRFSRTAKILTTVFFFLVTAVLPLLLAWYCLDVLMRPLVDVMQNRG